MPALADSTVRQHLLARRGQLVTVMQPGIERPVVELLQEVDAALERVDTGTFGWCDVCHEPIEADTLLRDPLVRVCLECLTPHERQRLERDLEAAAQIQAGLLPPREQTQNGWHIAYHYQPMGPVSGDYCDVIRPARPEGDLHVVFGDVAGKGVAASMLMTHLHATFRALAALDLPLAELVGRANRLFSESTLANMYATLVVGRFGSSGEVEMANLAHCSPLVLAGSEISSVSATGHPLGLFRSTTTETRRFQLTAGDRLFLYTDGLSEGENERGEAYGEDRIKALVAGSAAAPPANALQTCLSDWRAFTGGANRDDLTAMVISRVEPI
jgi:sigma-B regulation protein RsbU (phosphoserine phosphatase)